MPMAVILPARRVMIMAWVAAVATVTALSLRAATGKLRLGWQDLLLFGSTLAVLASIIMVLVQQRSIGAHNDATYSALFECHPQPVLLVDDVTLRIVAVNRAAIEKYGYDRAEFAKLSLPDLHLPEDREEFSPLRAGERATPRSALRMGVHITKHDATFAVETRSTTLDLNGRRLQITVVNDVTDIEEARLDARESSARYRQLFDTAREGIVTIDADRVITSINQEAADMLGYGVDELVGQGIPEFPATPGAEPEDDDSGERETTLQDKDGASVSVLLRESPLLDDEGNSTGHLGMFTDLTDRKGFEDELAFQALHDPVTGLPNRLMLVDRLQLALGRARLGVPDVAVCFVDIDDFKQINASRGHRDADRLLVEVARRLSATIDERDTVARFGGDEFVVVAEGTGDSVAMLVERLRAAMTAPWFIDDTQVNLTISMGVAVARSGERPGAILRGAEMALLQAKANGRGRTEFFTEALRATSRARLAMISDLRRAVERDEFSLRFQPVVSLTDEQIIGAEALIRWEHPQRGTLGPHEFIAIAEDAGLIDPIGQWVIEESCRRLAVWEGLMPTLTMSINVSARQLTAGTLNDIVRDAIAATGVTPKHLALEITETVLMDDAEFSLGVLTALRATGVTIAIDDFGTGYSSLAYLNRFPIDTLKIDQSFVAGLPDKACETALIHGMLVISKALGLSVVAEGVETDAQADALAGFGCLKAQGYHFYEPLTAEQFESALIASRAKWVAHRDLRPC